MVIWLNRGLKYVRVEPFGEGHAASAATRVRGEFLVWEGSKGGEVLW